ncbi:MAG: F0F1 ATP synthase subunit delta [Bacilli bacterium]|nr:F0F1 ATP synthase subunit delta [Bacilli bacterium]
MLEIARNYAEALLSIANDENKVVDYQLEVKQLMKIIKDNPDFLVLLDSRFLSVSERKEKVSEILVNFSEDIVNFVKIIVAHNRISNLEDILQAFNTLCNEKRDVVEGLIYTAFPLKEETLLKIKQKISQIEHHDVDLIVRIDPSLIGGVKVVINSHVYDGSVKNKLEKMQIDLSRKEF